jgi:acyl-coenzyme A synthetase/AMP-(fatty) acid ligase
MTPESRRLADFASELPKTETGKIKRNLLRSP